MATLHECRDKQAIVCLKGTPAVVAKMRPALLEGQPMSKESVHEDAEVGIRVLPMATATPAAGTLTWKLRRGGTSYVIAMGVNLLLAFVISLEKQFWRDKEVGSDAQERPS